MPFETGSAPPATHVERYGMGAHDLVQGAVFEHETRRTLLDHDNTLVSLLAMNTHPVHIDYAYAAATEFGKPLAVSPLLVSTLSAIVFNDFRQLALRSFEIREMTFKVPVFPNNTLRARSEVLERSDGFALLALSGFKDTDADTGSAENRDTEFCACRLALCFAEPG